MTIAQWRKILQRTPKKRRASVYLIYSDWLESEDEAPAKIFLAKLLSAFWQWVVFEEVKPLKATHDGYRWFSTEYVHVRKLVSRERATLQLELFRRLPGVIRTLGGHDEPQHPHVTYHDSEAVAYRALFNAWVSFNSFEHFLE